MPKTPKKLVLISVTSVSIINSGEKVVRMPCIYYLIRFQEEKIKALLNSDSKVNAMNPDYAWKLGLKI